MAENGAVVGLPPRCLESPRDKPFIPSWNRVQAAFPDMLERLHEAVELDHRGEV